MQEEVCFRNMTLWSKFWKVFCHFISTFSLVFEKVKLFLLWKSSNSNKACARILIMQIERWALLNNENFVLVWISPIRHISQTAEKYGFRAICPHIKKISWFLDSSEQWKCAQLPLKLQQCALKDSWPNQILFLIS